MPKDGNTIFEKTFNQAVRKLKANERDIENAIKQVLSNEELKITEEEYNELKKFTNALNEIDSKLENL